MTTDDLPHQVLARKLGAPSSLERLGLMTSDDL